METNTLRMWQLYDPELGDVTYFLYIVFLHDLALFSFHFRLVNCLAMESRMVDLTASVLCTSPYLP
jgi:hypothetical protein